jgi:hypothetical protein
MVRRPEQGVLQVGEVAFHVDRENLPPAIAGKLVSERKSGQHQA